MSVATSTTQAQQPTRAGQSRQVLKRQSNLFICFAPEEGQFAHDLDQALRKRRRVSNIDWQSPNHATSASEAVMRQIELAETFVFIVSPSSVASEVCRTQLREATRLRKPVAAISRTEVNETQLPSPLSASTMIDYREQVDYQKAFEQVISAVNTNLRIDVFICYSRDDGQFVKQLYEELHADGRRVWLDLNSIPASAIWEKEIYGGIEAADNFIFVISPSSVRPGSFCHKELAHAVANNKRIIPLFHRTTNDAEIPASLAQYQRENFPAGGDFSTHLASLLSVLDEDPGYLREHTRLLTRAIEWQRSGDTDKSLLLRGADLLRAEEMIGKSANKRPQFTNLQIQYVVASRTGANRTRNKLLTSAGVVIILMAILSVGLLFQTRSANAARRTAVEQSQEATKQKDLAEQQRREAEHQQTVAEEQRSIAQAKAKEALDAAEAERRARDQAEERRREADRERNRAQQQTLVSQARELVLSGETKIKSDAGLSLLLSIEAAKRDQLAEGRIDARISSLLQRSLFAAIPRVVTGAQMEAVAWKPNGQLLAAGSSDGQVILISLPDMNISGRFKTEGWVESLSWTSDGNLLAAGTREKGVIVWDDVTKKLLSPLSVEDQVTSVNWLKDTRRLAVALARADNSIIRVFDWSGQKTLFEVPGIRSAWSPNGRMLATGGGNGVVGLFTADGQPIAEMPAHSRYVHRISWTSDSKRFATSSVDDTVIVWDAVKYQRIVSLPAPFALSVSWNPDGSLLASGSGDDLIAVWNGISYEPLQTFKSSSTLTGDQIAESGALGYVVDTDWSPDGKILAASDRGTSSRNGGSVILLPARFFTVKTAQQWLEFAKAIVTRRLSRDECKEFLHVEKCQTNSSSLSP